MRDEMMRRIVTYGLAAARNDGIEEAARIVDIARPNAAPRDIALRIRRLKRDPGKSAAAEAEEFAAGCGPWFSDSELRTLLAKE